MGDGIAEMRAEAHAGNTKRIYVLLEQYPSVLRRIDDDFPFADTPLHIAVQKTVPDPENDEQITSNRRYGEFALEMMNLKPSFARKLNPSGLSPMHLAVQNKQILVVRKLLKIDKDLARLKGNGGQTPLHFAADQEALDLLVVLLVACPECITDMNIHGQTAFQVAVKNGSHEAAELLASWIHRSTHKDSITWERVVLNGEDHDGNTVLHIAAQNNNPQMVRLLLKFNVSKNRLNLNRQTALGISEGQNNGRETRDVLRRAKCQKGSAIPPRPTLVDSLTSTEFSSIKVLLRDLKRQRMRLSNESLNTLLVVYALILTTTYQAFLSPPDGFTQENNPGNFTQGNITDFHNISPTNQPPPRSGVSVLNPKEFSFFYCVNSLTFGVTIFVMMALLYLKRMANVILIYPPLILFICCYSNGVSMISPTHTLVYSGLPFFTLVFLGCLLLGRQLYYYKFAA